MVLTGLSGAIVSPYDGYVTYRFVELYLAMDGKTQQ